MKLGNWFQHVYAMSFVLLLHISASLSLGLNHSNVTGRCLERERHALLAIKGDLKDDYKLISSWGSEDCCGWERVQCDHRTGHVIQLHLGGLYVISLQGEYMWKHLEGEISPKIIELQYLKYLDLSNNYFNSGQSLAVIFSLSNLRHLDLHYSYFYWSKIPLIGNLTNLRYLDLSQSLSDVNPIFIGNLINLRYLDLSQTWSAGNLKFIGNLTNLRYLDLSWSELGSEIPYLQLGNLTHLQYLNLGNIFDFSSNVIRNRELSWLLHLSSLKYLDLTWTNLSKASDWLELISKLPNLRNLTLQGCDLPSPILSTLSHINSSNSLIRVDLSHNQISTLHPDAFNQLTGWMPNAFANMSSLKHLDLSHNLLEGRISTFGVQSCSLQIMDVSHNRLHGQLSEFVQTLSVCTQNSLEELHLNQNELSGSIPDLTNFQSLKEVYLSKNQLRGIIPETIGKLSSLMILDLKENQLGGRLPESIGQLSALKTLDLSENQLSGIVPKSIGQLSNLSNLNLSKNSLEGMISEVHFSKLSALGYLDLSHNPLVLNIRSDWVPPFQLSSLSLKSCKVGQYFPNWLRTQRTLFYLDISYAGISDVIPSWFSSHFGSTQTIDLSHNQIRGTFESSILKDASLSGFKIYLGSNQLEGPIPSILLDAMYIDLSDNKFSDMSSLCVTSKPQGVKFLNLSGNQFSGEIPGCWRHLDSLQLLDLSSNGFSGNIPTTIGSLFRMETLKLRSNKLVGELPSSLKNCRSLKVIDLGDNKLSRSVPEWIGVSFPHLVILMLQSNLFRGSLPSQLCHLAHIQILDFSMNEISGTIPKCLGNLTSLTQGGNSTPTIGHSIDPYVQTPNSIASGPVGMLAFAPMSNPYGYYEDEATFMWKGRMSAYKSTLGLVKRIDLSSNNITGEIPIEITQLLGLVSLNLSRNNLTGHIPSEIGKLQLLDSLDLSRNQIDGKIPISLARIDRLSYLDLSYNKLSGEIPTGTQLQSFDPSFYAGNPLLCGLPLENICDQEGNGRPNVSSDKEDRDELISQGFFTSLGVGFAVGFWGVCGSLIFKRSWRYAYYNFLNALNDWLYVRLALIRQKLKEMLKRQS